MSRPSGSQHWTAGPPEAGPPGREDEPIQGPGLGGGSDPHSVAYAKPGCPARPGCDKNPLGGYI